MNKAEVAFRVAVSRLGVEQASPILKGSNGTRELKTIVLCAAIGQALRQVIDTEQVLVDGEYFYDVEEFIRMNFGDLLASAVTKLGVDEVHATCDLSIFKPRDVIVISGEGMKERVELSIERLVYQALVEALDDYMSRDRVNINTLVVALDAVHQATLKVCVNAAKMAMIIHGGKQLK